MKNILSAVFIAALLVSCANRESDTQRIYSDAYNQIISCLCRNRNKVPGEVRVGTGFGDGEFSFQKNNVLQVRYAVLDRMESDKGTVRNFRLDNDLPTISNPSGDLYGMALHADWITDDGSSGRLKMTFRTDCVLLRVTGRGWEYSVDFPVDEKTAGKVAGILGTAVSADPVNVLKMVYPRYDIGVNWLKPYRDYLTERFVRYEVECDHDPIYQTQDAYTYVSSPKPPVPAYD